MPSLRFFSLADNNLSRVSESLVQWKDLLFLDVSGNPWSCDCDLNFLGRVVSWLREKQEAEEAVETGISDGKCAQPPSMRQRSLSDVGHVACRNEPEVVMRHEPQFDAAADSGSESGAFSSSTVIISVSVSASIILMAVLLFVVFTSRRRWQDWAKALRWHRRDAAAAAAARKGASIYDGASIVDPYLRHEYRQPPFYSCDDEHYYYVSTMQNRMTAGKHIPVTEL